MESVRENFKIDVTCGPRINEEDKAILEKIFGKDRLILHEYIEKGISGGVIDVQFFIEFITQPNIQLLFIGLVIAFIQELFERNRSRKLDKNRPRYINVVIRKERSHIIVSNANKENKLTISKHGKVAAVTTEYSPEELKKFMNEQE